MDSRRPFNLPNWTVLPPLALKGIGTVLVESLHSYVRRMMEITGISGLDLASYLHDQTGGLVSAKWTSRPMLGLGAAEVARIKEFERLTGMRTLRFGTLWAMSDVLSINSNLYGAKSRQWCPRCYAEWDDESYEPLLWSIDIAWRCPGHDCDLERNCPACGERQFESYRTARRMQCGRCGCGLGHNGRRSKKPMIMRWMDDQCRLLVEFCVNPRSEPMLWGDYLYFLSGLRESAHAYGDLETHMRTLLYGTDLRVRVQSQRPTIRTLLNLCALQGISMAELLTSPRGASGPLLFNPWAGLKHLPLPAASQARWIYVTLRSIETFTRRRPPYLPPIEFFVTWFGVNLPSLIDADPALCKRYIERCARQVPTCRSKNLYRVFCRCINKLIDKPGSSSGPGKLLKKTALMMELNSQEAKKVALASFLARDCLAQSSVDSLKAEMTVRHALEWLLERWETDGEALGLGLYVRA